MAPCFRDKPGSDPPSYEAPLGRGRVLDIRVSLRRRKKSNSQNLDCYSREL